MGHGRRVLRQAVRGEVGECIAMTIERIHEQGCDAYGLLSRDEHPLSVLLRQQCEGPLIAAHIGIAAVARIQGRAVLEFVAEERGAAVPRMTERLGRLDVMMTAVR